MLYSITVDTEEEWDWSSGYPTKTGEVDNISQLQQFQSACDRFGAKVTYFTNHSVLANQVAAERISALQKSPSVEIGLHIHPWNTPPVANSTTVTARESFLHQLPRDEAFQKLDSVFSLFESNRIKPTSYRGGRYSTCDWIQEYLSKRGVIADASILPFTTWTDTGAPDFRKRDLTPVRRTMPDGLFIWEIPLTLAFTRGPWRFWSRFYQAAQRHPLRKFRLIGVLERIYLQRVWLNLENPLHDSMPRLLTALRRSKLPCLNITLHSSSLKVGKSPYVRNSHDLRRLYERLEEVLTILHSWPEALPATITQTALQLERQFHARSGN